MFLLLAPVRNCIPGMYVVVFCRQQQQQKQHDFCTVHVWPTVDNIYLFFLSVVSPCLVLLVVLPGMPLDFGFGWSVSSVVNVEAHAAHCRREANKHEF